MKGEHRYIPVLQERHCRNSLYLGIPLVKLDKKLLIFVVHCVASLFDFFMKHSWPLCLWFVIQATQSHMFPYEKIPMTFSVDE